MKKKMRPFGRVAKGGAIALSDRLTLGVRACVIGLGVMFVVMVLLSLLMSVASLPIDMANVLSSASIIVGCFVAGFVLLRGIRENGLLYGGLCGLTIYAILVICSLMYDPSFSQVAPIKAVMTMLSGAIGGVSGINIRR